MVSILRKHQRPSPEGFWQYAHLSAESDDRQRFVQLSAELDAVISDVELKNPSLPGAGGLRQASDLRLLSAIKHIVVKDMLKRIKPRTAPQ